ncbi:MAG: hypothetical protein Q9221_001983 [Calogaya cf. arnoldii]
MALAVEGCALLLSKYEHPYQRSMEYPEYPYQHQTGRLSHSQLSSLPPSPYNHGQHSSDMSQYADLGYPLVNPSPYNTRHTISNIPQESLSVFGFPHEPPSDLSQYADLGYPSFYPSPYNMRPTFHNILPQSLGVFHLPTPSLIWNSSHHPTGASAAPPLTYPSRGEDGSFQMGLTQSTLGQDASLVNAMPSLQNGTSSSMETLLMPPSPTSLLSSPATVPLTEAAKPVPKKRGPGRPKKSLMVVLHVSVDEGKLPVKKEDRPPKNKEPSTSILTPPSSDTSNGLPKKRGRPRKEERVQSPSRSTTKASKRPRKYVKDPAKPTRPTKAELAHLTKNLHYVLDSDDGQLSWLLPDGSVPEYEAHPGHGKKYQWGHELPEEPNDYVGDDRDEGERFWNEAELQHFKIQDPDSYPMSVEEDAEGERDVTDPVSGIPELD